MTQNHPDPQTVRTPWLDVDVFEWNPTTSHSVVLAHGWPDCAHSWFKVAQTLAQAGWRVIVPALRGFGQTRFLDNTMPRSGQLSALGRDMIHLIEAMNLDKPVLVVDHLPALKSKDSLCRKA